MTDSETSPQTDLLAAFRLGPSWARDPVQKREYKESDHEETARERTRDGGRSGRFGRGRDGGGQGFGGDRRGDRERGNRGERRERRDNRDDGRGGWGQRGERYGAPEVLVPSARGVRVEVHPSWEAVHVVAREIQQVARVYSLFEIAQVLLADRNRYRLSFRVADSAEPLLRSRKDDSLWLTRAEAVAHFWNAPWRGELYEEQTIEVSPPRGNFQVIARCGLSGEWLGPPNFHGYQTAIRRVHRERFSNMPFERYVANVRTERGEEAINAWLATQTTHTRFRPVGGGDDEWMTDRAEVERHFVKHRFPEVFEETRVAEVPGSISARNLTPSLLESLKLATAHARKHPAMIIPGICQMLERGHVPVFKREGRLFSGPARPHPLADDVVLAERPAAIVRWLADHPQAKLADLWHDLLPEGQEGPCELWLADLLWLLNQGHVLLFSNDFLVLPHRRQGAGASQPASTTAEPVVSRVGEATKPVKKRTKPRRPKRARKITPMIVWVRKTEHWTPRRLRKLRLATKILRYRLKLRSAQRAVVEEPPPPPEEEVA